MGVLQTWVLGVPFDEGHEFTVTLAALAGEVLGRLHGRAERFPHPEWFERPTYDAAYFRHRGSLLSANVATEVGDLRAADLTEAMRKFLSELGPLSDLAGGYGLIHGDPHPGNFLEMGEGAMGLVDFDRCGWGPYLLDLAHVDLALDGPERAALLTGYTTARSLPSTVERPLRSLRVLAAIDNLAHLSQSEDEIPGVLEALPNVEAFFAQSSCGR